MRVRGRERIHAERRSTRVDCVVRHTGAAGVGIDGHRLATWGRADWHQATMQTGFPHGRDAASGDHHLLGDQLLPHDIAVFRLRDGDHYLTISGDGDGFAVGLSTADRAGNHFPIDNPSRMHACRINRTDRSTRHGRTNLRTEAVIGQTAMPHPSHHSRRDTGTKTMLPTQAASPNSRKELSFRGRGLE